MIAVPLRLLRNLVANLALLLRNTVVAFRRVPEWVRIDVHGRIPERPQPRRLFGRRGRSIADLRELFLRVGADPRVRGVVMGLRDLDIGWARLDSLRGLIAGLRASGKKVVVLLRAAGNREYYLACAADRIVLEPPASLGLVGLAAEATFLGGLLEAAGVRADLHPVGEFKTAADALRRDEMSPAHRAQVDALLDDADARFCAAIAEGRGLVRDEVRARIDEGPFAPDRALAAGLVDAVRYADELPEWLAMGTQPWAVSPGRKRVRLSSSRTYLASRVRWSWVPPWPRRVVAVVPVRGLIVEGEGARLPFPVCGGEAVARALRAARENPRVGAVVLHVDSPGGSALASDRIWREAALLGRKKPLVAWMGDVAASGGYYAACAAHAIVAQPGTLTGSIGVVGGKISLAGLYAKLGVRKEILARGAHAGMFSEARDFTDDERARLLVDLGASYDEFVWRVAAGRGMTVEVVEPRAGGRVFSGRAARDLGLVDEIGDLESAIEEAGRRARRRARERLDARDVPATSGAPSILGRLFGALGPLALAPVHVRILVLSLALGVGLLGCAAHARPDAAVHAYADALERGDVEAAWSMLAPDARARYTHDEFAEALRASPDENRRTARALREAAPQARVGAIVRYDDGEMRLVRAGEVWRIDVDPLDFYPQGTPRDALRSFVRAVERRRYDVLLRLAPEKWQRAMTVEDLRRDFEGPRRAELDALLRALKSRLGEAIAGDGDRATLRYGDGAEVRFVREGQVWKVEDPD